MRYILAVIFLLSGLLSHAQNYYRAVSLTLGTRVNSNYKFDWGTTEYDLYVLIETMGNRINIYSAVPQTYYKVGKLVERDSQTYFWRAIDKEGDECNLYMMKLDGHVYLFVEFDNIGWYYEVINN